MELPPPLDVALSKGDKPFDNREYWLEKYSRNVANRKAGYTVFAGLENMERRAWFTLSLSDDFVDIIKPHLWATGGYIVVYMRSARGSHIMRFQGETDLSEFVKSYSHIGLLVTQKYKKGKRIY